MKKLVVETIVKEVNDNVENIIDKTQFVQQVTETINKTETYVAPESTLTVTPFQGGKGAKSIRIISDLPLKMSYTSQATTYDFGCYMNEITLLGDETSEEFTQGFVAKYGSITLENRNTEDTAHVKIIYTY